MPKEVTTDSIDLVNVEVSWHNAPTGHVQIATLGDTEPVYEGPTTQDGGTDGRRVHGWHATLDRDGINRVIRHLRRARDQAFGRDE